MKAKDNPPGTPPNTWFMTVAATAHDFRAMDCLSFDEKVRVQIKGGPLRRLIWLTQGNIHQLEYLVSDGFNRAIAEAVKQLEGGQCDQ